jgi:hypothetical protein
MRRRRLRVVEQRPASYIECMIFRGLKQASRHHLLLGLGAALGPSACRVAGVTAPANGDFSKSSDGSLFAASEDARLSWIFIDGGRDDSSSKV